MNFLMQDTMGALAAIFSILYFILLLLLVGFSFYAMIVYIKLAKKGIQALDIYVDKNEKKDNP